MYTLCPVIIRTRVAHKASATHFTILIEMSNPVNPPFRAEHTGSYLRPAELLRKRIEFHQGRCSAGELKDAEDNAIKHIVQMQKNAGIKSITDGEMRRFAFFDGVFENLEGHSFLPKAPLKEMMTMVPYISQMLEYGMVEFPTFYCSGKIKRTKGFYTEDWKYLKSLLPPKDIAGAKITMCSPDWLHSRHGSHKTYDKTVYQNDDEYFADIAKAYQEEIRDLYELGCRNIQFDSPTFCFFCAEEMTNGLQKVGIDQDNLLDKYIGLINACLRGKPTDMNVGIHMCHGNYKGTWYSEGGYDRIAAKLFQNLNVQCYYLEYDTERSGSFEPLKYLPLGKTVILGLVSTKTARMEDITQVKKRIDEAATIISQGFPKRSRATAYHQICIGPQCGFAAQFEGNPISEEDQQKKLSLVVKVATEVWKDVSQ
ncbi:UROD/MetE-like protein [Rickenella mellea]|uniref:UROD/MetE-like protein n=1 Tax=Rickenella mellea TaxID=50990 RepID=A0A4Y7QLT4_9AGAM|nr:UROD/MetE-like protein [Rickenella mellea]